MMRVPFKIIGVSGMALALAFSGCGDKSGSSSSSDDRSRSGAFSPKVTEDAKLALGVNLDKQQAFKVVDAYLEPICEMMQLGDKDVAEAKAKVAEYKKDLFADAPLDVRAFLDESGLRDAELRWAVISAEDLKFEDGVLSPEGFSWAIAGKFDSKKLISAIRTSLKDTKGAVEFKELTVGNERAWRVEPQRGSLVRDWEKLGVDLHVTSLDGQLVLAASSRNTLEKQIRLYRDGKGKGDVLGGFSAKSGDLLHLTVSDIGEMIRRNGDSGKLRRSLQFLPGGDQLVLGLKVFETEVRVSSDGKLSESLSLKTASDEDADKIRTLAKTGLMMARAQMAKEANVPEMVKKWVDGVVIGGENDVVRVRNANFMFAMAALFPAISSAMLNANLSSMAMRGRKLIQGFVQANVERQGKLGPVWPRTVAAGEGASDDVAARAYRSATDYFNALFDLDHYGTSNWDPVVEGDLLSSLWGCGVPGMSGKTLGQGNVAWIVAANVTDETPDFVPVLITANFNPSLLLRKWDGHTDGSVRLPIGPVSGAEANPFGNKGIVIVRKSGAVETIKAKFLTYDNLYHKQAFDLTNMNPPLVYLTPRGIAEPVGHQ